jgi:hypothetical protein
MSERGYFSQRYLIPGSVFLLFVLIFNFAPLIRILERQQATSSLFGGVVALLSSPTIGFLVSQLWWHFFHRKMGFWSWKPVQVLIKKYKLPAGQEVEAKKNVLMIYDYVLHSELHSSENKTNGLSGYVLRRYDNYVLLSVAELSLALGAVVGILSRVLCEFFVFKNSFWQEPNAHSLTLLGWTEYWILVTVLITVLILMYFIEQGQNWVKHEYEEIHEMVVRSSKITRKKLIELFPEYFPDEKPAYHMKSVV